MTTGDRTTEPLPSDQLKKEIAALTRHQTELETINESLVIERDTLKRKLTDCSRFMQASTTGLISLDKSGLIDGVSSRAVDMLGADKSYLLKKPISLFIAPEDQAVFYINRSRIFAGTSNAPFELKLKTKNGTLWSASINAQPVETPNQHLPGMLLAVEDITPYRQALEALQLKEYFVNLLFSIIDDLSVWSTDRHRRNHCLLAGKSGLGLGGGPGLCLSVSRPENQAFHHPRMAQRRNRNPGADPAEPPA